MMEVFKSLPEGTMVQLIENIIVMSPAPQTLHQSISIELSSPLYATVKKEKLGKVFSAPFDVYLDSTNVFQPDICFISNERMSLLKEDGLHGAPDLVIEILSPGTAKYDLTGKKAVYERTGVTELWFVDPADKAVTGYSLKENKYQLVFSGNGRLEIQCIDFLLNF